MNWLLDNVDETYTISSETTALGIDYVDISLEDTTAKKISFRFSGSDDSEEEGESYEVNILEQ